MAQKARKKRVDKLEKRIGKLQEKLSKLQKVGTRGKGKKKADKSTPAEAAVDAPATGEAAPLS